MERYNGSERRTTETIMMQGANSNPHWTATPPQEEIDVVDNEGAPEFIVDQGPYYPTATNYYGYYCTGFESPGEWDDHHRFFGLDGQDLHYTGLQTESFPYVYYTPSYGYAQSPYNPYNPYIPGAVIGVDGQFVGPQQYYTGPTYQHPVSSPYFPVIVQPSPDSNTLPNVSHDATLLNSGASSSRPDGAGWKHIPPPTSAGIALPQPRATPRNVRTEPPQSASHLVQSSANASLSKQPASHGTVSFSSVPQSTSSHATLGKVSSGSVQVADHFALGRASSIRNQLKVALPGTNGLVDFGSNTHGWTDKYRPRLQFGGALSSAIESPDVLGEQNRGPRTNRLKNQWTSPISVKAYTTKAGSSNAQGNIIIYADQYNKEDFPINYPNAKFFVVKSYSEDDVHKSIKYNVWSSTPNGNKRLDSAYEDAQRISGGKPGTCPIFLFFSVNASGQFCGVAEMIGPVDFHKDMDFWQQDKWSGSFPLKWHIIKDVPNTNFRHIILENNENKPVTNSRDTQEIMYMQGMEVLNIFKSYALKTSILDDFMYYEDRQKIIQAEKSRLLTESYETSFFLPSFVPSGKANGNINQPLKADEKPSKPNDLNSYGKTILNEEQVTLKLDTTDSSSKQDTKHNVGKDLNDVTPIMKIGSLSIDSKEEGNTNNSGTVTVTDTPSNVVTVGSMPVNVNGFGESFSGILTIGTIPINPKAQALNKTLLP
ncbi:evolutionarily conserved C-terminal region 7 [Tasmannia lanceolata]|uniref:evolutionarily conserved C-terminal region 7 n=1 Tax=Tasmannia lanceolata TaxID=3420 RepID=UPI004062FE7D